MRQLMAHCSKISTHTPLAGSDSSTESHSMPSGAISTHTPLAGSDGIRECLVWGWFCISTHTPLAGSDPMAVVRIQQ